ncbi:hypothetical protein MVEN_00877700 [Mycena venus]|uniref:Uncharacterized protein n=1 Tax=Mycena venus TaxID=2733690 RepID=A0A8H7D190_9AGAR|nr:hypothetical protein MVEN_00877700 [Mycena venus]
MQCAVVREHHRRHPIQLPTVSRHLSVGRVLAVPAQSNLFVSDFPPARKLRRQGRISAICPNASPRNVNIVDAILDSEPANAMDGICQRLDAFLSLSTVCLRLPPV